MDAAVGRSEWTTGAAPPPSDDLGGDADRGLLRRARSEVEADRAGQPVQLVVGQAGLAQPRHPVVVRAPGPHRADVRDVGQPQGDLEQGYVELRVVGEHGDDRAGVDPTGVALGREVAVRPVDDDLVRADEGKKQRPGQGKLRGRRFRQPKSLLFVVSGLEAPVLTAARNLPGVDVATPEMLSTELCAPGGDAGRLVVFTKSALTRLEAM